MARLFVVLVCSSVLGITAWRVNLARDLQLHDSAVASASLASAVADQAQATMEFADTLTADFVDRVERAGTSPEAIQQLHHALAGSLGTVSRIHALFVVNASGHRLASSLLGNPLADGYTDYEYLAHHRDNPGRRAFVGPPITSRQTGRWSITVSRRFDHPDGSFAGAVVALIEVGMFEAVYSRVEVGPNGSIALLSQEGIVLARVPVAPPTVGLNFAASPFFQDYRRQGPVGAASGPSVVDGVRRWTSFHKVDGYPLVVFVAKSQDDILAAWRQSAWTAVTAASVISIVLGLLGWRMVDQFRRRQQAEAAVNRSERQYRLLADNAEDLILQLGPDLRRVYVSPASRRLLGYEPDEMLHRHPQAICHPEDWPSVAAMFEAIGRDGYAPPVTCRISHKDGTERWVEASGRRLDQGGCVISMRDVSRRKAVEIKLHEANNHLQRLIMLDGLTGINNRRCFDIVLQKELRRAARSELPVALLLIDVDHFKSYNDINGHPAGDACLRGIADAINKQMNRPADLAARYGGEEFAVLLPETEITGALRMADLVRDAVRSLEIPHHVGAAGIVTVSIGVALVWPRPTADSALGSTATLLVQTADNALYQAKAEGRDRVCLGATCTPSDDYALAEPVVEQH